MSAANFEPSTRLIVGASWLLLSGPFIAVSPVIANILGTPEAIFLQQLHYWLNYKREYQAKRVVREIDERQWVYWTHEQLVKGIPLGRSIAPHKRVIRHLSALGILLVEQRSSNKWDRTCHYSINYEVLKQVLERGQLALISNGTKSPDRTGEFQTSDVQPSGEPISLKGADLYTESSSSPAPENTTTTKSVVGSDLISVLGSSSAFLELSERAEPYRKLVVELAVGLPAAQVQELCDELSQRLENAELPGGKPVLDVRSWSMHLVAELRAGHSVLRCGFQRTRARVERRKALAHAAEEAVRQELVCIADADARRHIQDRLTSCSDELLEQIISESVALASSPMIRERVQRSLNLRQLPPAAAGGIVQRVATRLLASEVNSVDAGRGAS